MLSKKLFLPGFTKSSRETNTNLFNFLYGKGRKRKLDNDPIWNSGACAAEAHTIELRQGRRRGACLRRQSSPRAVARGATPERGCIIGRVLTWGWGKGGWGRMDPERFGKKKKNWSGWQQGRRRSGVLTQPYDMYPTVQNIEAMWEGFISAAD